MKVLLYTEMQKTIGTSGLGKAIKHQMRSLEDNNIPYTLDPKDDFDIAHINFFGLKSYRLAKKCKKKGIKVVYHAHSTKEDFMNSFKFSNLIAPIFKWWICKCYKLGDHIITPTPYSKRLLESYGCFKRPITAISNGIDTKFFVREEKLGDNFRETYGFKKDDKVIVGIGLYLERKGILDFIELAKRMPEYKFIWFGRPYKNLVPRKINKAVKNAPKNIRFPGYVEPIMIKSALCGANLYIFPTHEETEGIPIMEACACKCKALISDIGVFEGWLEDKKNVYKAKNIDEFEDLARKIIENKLPDLTEAAYKEAIKKDVKLTGKELIQVYKDTLAGK